MAGPTVLKTTRLLLGRKLMKISGPLELLWSLVCDIVWWLTSVSATPVITVLCVCKRQWRRWGLGSGDGQGEGWSFPLRLSHVLLPDLDGGRGESDCVSASKPDGRAQSGVIKHQWPAWWGPNVVCPNQGFLTQSSLPAGSWQRFCVSGV